MPTINGRLICCQCGSDLGDAEDLYADPACGECLKREFAEENDDLETGETIEEE